ncbi:2-oxo acid dehydrogenase subunit E2 [Gammaproteobacteria bacterium]|nr:2-oxo acid dehydrogenase subunit E2 [Gammaproteobacteria bacterium]
MKIFNLPDLGEGLAEAEIREWFKKEGDIVDVDEPLLSMETAKALVDVPSPYAGRIIKLYGNKNDIIQTHSPLVEFEDTTTSNLKDSKTVVGNLEETEIILDDSNVSIGSSSGVSPSIKVIPSVRILAKKLNVDLSEINPTGSNGQITIDDIKKYSKGGDVSNSNVLSLKGVRLSMSKAMTKSHQEVVSVTISDDADISNLHPDVDLTVYIIKSIAFGCKAEPKLNCWFDGEKMELKLNEKVDLGLAIDTNDGLFVPVIKDIENKSNKDLRSEINKLKVEAKEKTLRLNALSGATITLSNFGVFSGKYATPIVVPPMVSIVGVGKHRKITGVKDDKIVIKRIIPLSISFDHRAITGGEATRFLSAIINFLENCNS